MMLNVRLSRLKSGSMMPLMVAEGRPLMVISSAMPMNSCNGLTIELAAIDASLITSSSAMAPVPR